MSRSFPDGERTGVRLVEEFELQIGCKDRKRLFVGSKPWNLPPGSRLWQRWPSKRSQRCGHHAAEPCYFSQLNRQRLLFTPTRSFGSERRTFVPASRDVSLTPVLQQITLTLPCTFLYVRAGIEAFYEQTLWIDTPKVLTIGYTVYSDVCYYRVYLNVCYLCIAQSKGCLYRWHIHARKISWRRLDADKEENTRRHDVIGK